MNTALLILSALTVLAALLVVVSVCGFVADCRVRRVANAIGDAARNPDCTPRAALANHLSAGGR